MVQLHLFKSKNISASSLILKKNYIRHKNFASFSFLGITDSLIKIAQILKIKLKNLKLPFCIFTNLQRRHYYLSWSLQNVKANCHLFKIPRRHKKINDDLFLLFTHLKRFWKIDLLSYLQNVNVKYYLYNIFKC